MRRACALLQGVQRMRRRRAVFWRWPLSMTGRGALEAAAIGGVTLQIVRDWVIKFNAHGPDGLIARKAPGQPPKLNEAHRAALRAAIESGPTAAIDGVVRWRLVDLCQWIWEEFRVGIAKQTLSRELRAMGYRKLSARPRQLMASCAGGWSICANGSGRISGAASPSRP